jgi:hypothetical protein
MDQTIQDLRIQIGIHNDSPTRGFHEAAIHFRASDEIFGISPLPDRIMNMLNIKRITNNPSMESSRSVLRQSTLLILCRSTRQKSQYVYLAEKQQAMYPILPVHTEQEKDLFKELMRTYNYGGRAINWEELAILWCQKVNQADPANDGPARRHICSIYYKTAAHLKSYFVTWNEASNRMTTIVANRSIVSETRAHLSSPSRVRSAPPATDPAPAKVPRTEENQLGGTTMSHIHHQAPFPLVSLPVHAVPSQVHINPINPTNAHTEYRLSHISVDLSKSRRTRICSTCRSFGCPGSNKRNRCPLYQS